MLTSSGEVLLEGLKLVWSFVTANEFLVFLVGTGLVARGFGMFRKAKRATH